MQVANPQRTYLEILPVFSGYRDDKQRMQFTTNYAHVYRQAGLDDQFRVVIPMSELRSARLFSVEAYEKFKAVEAATA